MTEEDRSLTGPRGEAVVRPPDKRGARKVPRGHEQYHGFWRVVYYPSPGEMLSAPEILRAKDEEEAERIARAAVEEGFDAVRDARYGRGRY